MKLLCFFGIHKWRLGGWASMEGRHGCETQVCLWCGRMRLEPATEPYSRQVILKGNVVVTRPPSGSVPRPPIPPQRVGPVGECGDCWKLNEVLEYWKKKAERLKQDATNPTPNPEPLGDIALLATNPALYLEGLERKRDLIQARTTRVLGGDLFDAEVSALSMVMAEITALTEIIRVADG